MIYGAMREMFCRSIQSGSSQKSPSGISFPQYRHLGCLNRFHQAFNLHHMAAILALPGTNGDSLNEATVALLIFLLGLAFTAGAYAASARAARKQINGLGARVNRVVLAVIDICPPEKQREVTAMMMGISLPAGDGKDGK